jgi:hypothetical protein
MLQAQLTFADYAFEARHFASKDTTAPRSESVVASSWIVILGTVAKLLDKPSLDQLLQIVIKRTWPQLVLAL